MAFAIFSGARGSRFVGDHKLGPIVAKISMAADAPINSHARDQAAAALLHDLGQHTQAEVIELHRQGVPGFGPANPVNRTTHCRFNDGIAYRFWPPFFKIPWWARGIDVRPEGGGVPRFCAEARREGFIVTPTYPGSVGEAQHVNFRKLPRLLPPPLKRGAKRSPRVWALKKNLRALGYFHGDGGHSGFGKRLQQAVVAFQKANHLAPDGVVGPHTQAAIKAALRRKGKRR
jgi:hypothetical protein